MKMTQEQMLTYMEQFNGKRYEKGCEQDVVTATKKVEEVLKKFGFQLHSSFGMRIGNVRKKNTSWFYRCKLNEHDYIEVQVGYIEKTKTYGSGRRAKPALVGFDGLFRVTRVVQEINPATGVPYRVGEIKYVNANYSLVLTNRGWSSGD